MVAVGCVLHAAAGCLYSPLQGKGSRRHSAIVADAGGFCRLKSIFDAADKCLHEFLWINPWKCGQACM